MSLASRKLIQATAGSAGVEAASDDDFANVVLLLDGDGTSGDNNETFTDSSTNGYTVTESGSVIQGSFSPYGDNWSVYFDGSSEIQTDSTINIGTSNFTIEFWVNWDGQDTDSSFVATDGTTGNSWVVRLVSGSLALRVSGTTDISTTHTMEEGVWTHIAAVREGTGSNQTKIYVNGTKAGEGTASYDYGSRKFNIGAGRGSSPNNVGYLSNVRLVVGTAVYTSDFTPSTSSLTDITNTKLLTCQSNRFVDNSSIGDTFTLTGPPKVTPFSPFKDDDARDITTDGGSAYFEYGATNALSVPADANLDLSTGDFTVEMWVYLDSKINDSKLYLDWTNTSNYWQFKYDSSYGWSLQYAGGTWIVNNGSASNVNVGEWQHLALTRSGSNFTIWQNGESFATGTSSANIGVYNAKNIGGWTGGSLSIDGYISDFRLTKGTALYSSSFTPPTSPISAGANTELFLKFQDAGIYDRSGINNLDTVGNAQIDTSVVKYGTGSMEFDGTGDWLVVPSKDEMDLGTADFTWEAWVWADSATTNNWYDSRSGTGTSDGFMIGTSSSQLFFYTANAIRIQGTPAFTGQTWNHVAVSRESGTTKLFLNGTQIGSSYSDSNNYTQPTIYIGRNVNAAGQFNGYIDDLRITKGVARYTANFTPPTDALPKF